MLKSPYRLAIPAAIVAAALAGCDTQGESGAQGGEEVSSETEVPQLTGFVDRTFAGSALPDVELEDPAGITLALSQTTGKPVLMNIWATWCVPCVVEMPMLDSLASEIGEDVRVLTVSADIQGAEKVVPFFEANGFANLPRWMDQQGHLAEALGGGGSLPITILYDAEGKEVWRVIGAYDWHSDEALMLIAEALPEDS